MCKIIQKVGYCHEYFLVILGLDEKMSNFKEALQICCLKLAIDLADSHQTCLAMTKTSTVGADES